MPLSRTIAICALGYFIDVFDIQLFGILRVPSLTSLGVSADQITNIGGYILNAQMVGMVLGAFLWGWMGDQMGRSKTLYGSILIYSLGTLACSFAPDALTYGILRFVTGFGLAGETGAAITLVAEMMPQAKRTLGVIIAAGVGMFGPIAAITASMFLPWRSTYLLAGILGLCILLLRVKLVEPSLFMNAMRQNVTRGSLRLFAQKPQLKIVFFCILVGMPQTYFWFLLNFYSAEFAHSILSPDQVFNPKMSFLAFYLGTAAGDFGGGFLSHFWQSRRKVLATCFSLGAVAGGGLLLFGEKLQISALAFYLIYFAIGCAGGCWVIMAMFFAEQFGTNVRATAAIVLSNIVRGLSIPVITLFLALRQSMDITMAALFVGLGCIIPGFLALLNLRETHGLDLDYVERLEQKTVTTPN